MVCGSWILVRRPHHPCVFWRGAVVYILIYVWGLSVRNILCGLGGGQLADYRNNWPIEHTRISAWKSVRYTHSKSYWFEKAIYVAWATVHPYWVPGTHFGDGDWPTADAQKQCATF